MILIGPLSAVEHAIKTHRPSHVISLLDPETMIDTPTGIAPERHLRVGINDVAQPSDFLVAPGESHVREIVDFARAWDQTHPMLVHCWAGISRSSAAAFIALCALNEAHEEAALARAIRAGGSHTHPNRLMVDIADDVLAREGRMRAAVEALGPGRVTWEGELFGVPARPESAPR